MNNSIGVYDPYTDSFVNKSVTHEQSLMIEEIQQLEWLNNALKYQIQLNQNRLDELNRKLEKEVK